MAKNYLFFLPRISRIYTVIFFGQITFFLLQIMKLINLKKLIEFINKSRQPKA